MTDPFAGERLLGVTPEDYKPHAERCDPTAVGGAKRPNLIKWAKIRYPLVSGKAWLKATNEGIRLALIHPDGFVPDVVKRQHEDWKRGLGGMERGSRVKGTGTQADKLKAAIEALASLSMEEAPSKDEVFKLVDERFATLKANLNMPVVVEVRREGTPPVVVEGQHKFFKRLLDSISLRDPVILTGPPGTGKSYAAHRAAEVLGLAYHEISVGPTMTESRLLGWHDANGRYIQTGFRKAYEYGGVFLLDEADNGSGAVIAVLNNAMANGRCSFPDGIVARHKDFVLVVAANTVGHGATREYLGRQNFDGPFRDRLTFIEWPVDEALEEAIATAIARAVGYGEQLTRDWIGLVRQLRAKIEKSGQVRVVASPRATFKGIQYLAKGWSQQDTLEACLWKQASPEVRAKIEGAK